MYKRFVFRMVFQWGSKQQWSLLNFLTTRSRLWTCRCALSSCALAFLLFPPADSHPQTWFREATHGSCTEKQQHEPKTNLPKTDDAWIAAVSFEHIPTPAISILNDRPVVRKCREAGILQFHLRLIFSDFSSFFGVTVCFRLSYQHPTWLSKVSKSSLKSTVPALWYRWSSRSWPGGVWSGEADRDSLSVGWDCWWTPRTAFTDSTEASTPTGSAGASGTTCWATWPPCLRPASVATLNSWCASMAPWRKAASTSGSNDRWTTGRPLSRSSATSRTRGPHRLKFGFFLPCAWPTASAWLFSGSASGWVRSRWESARQLPPHTYHGQTLAASPVVSLLAANHVILINDKKLL